MSDQWYYYAEEGAARGPMTLAELASILARFSDPYRVPVWRPGFERWQWAHDVRDVVAALAQHPRSDASLLTPPRRGTSHTAKLRPTVAPKLSGIGGWLILMAIGQVLGPLRFVVSMVQYYSSLDGDLLQKAPMTFVGEGLMNAALGVLYAWTVILFFTKSKRFPRFFVYEVIATVIALPVSAAWVALAIGWETGQSAGQLFLNAFELREIGQTIAAAIGGSIWILYLLKSRRVANTFVN
jgi:hypothetical protein